MPLEQASFLPIPPVGTDRTSDREARARAGRMDPATLLCLSEGHRPVVPILWRNVSRP